MSVSGDFAGDPAPAGPAAVATGGRVRLVPTPYDAPVVQAMVAEVQRVYRDRYGGPDETPMGGDDFTGPRGHFVVVYVDGDPVAMGGWRLRADVAAAGLPGRRPAEIKRMFVRAGMRGRGLSRVVLADLEQSARRAGVDWLVLETGDRQPEAVGLYLSSGYVPIAPFGLYADEEGSVYLGKRL